MCSFGYTNECGLFVTWCVMLCVVVVQNVCVMIVMYCMMVCVVLVLCVVHVCSCV